MVICYVPICLISDAGPAEAVHPGHARVMVPGQGHATFRHCLLFHVTLEERRTKGALIPPLVNCLHIPQQKVLETETFSNLLPNSLTLLEDLCNFNSCWGKEP